MTRETTPMTFTISKESAEKLKTIPKGLMSRFINEAIKRTNIELVVTYNSPASE